MQKLRRMQQLRRGTAHAAGQMTRPLLTRGASNLAWGIAAARPSAEKRQPW
jgi:hypothetical protein